MEHVKMLPQFLKMGYQNSQFIMDYNSKKLTFCDYYYLCKWYKQDKMTARDRFIGTYCAMRADNNPFHIYIHLYLLLFILDRKLFKIVRAFWNEWLRYDTIKQPEFIEPSYSQIISNFVHSLANVYSKKS